MKLRRYPKPIWLSLSFLCFGCGNMVPKANGPATTQPESFAVRYVAAQDPKEHEAGDTGSERWAVKLMRDPGAAKVNLTPNVATVEQLIALPVPFKTFPSDNTRYPSECQTYTVTGKIVGGKLEQDGDLHVVIAGTSGKTMIIEFPNPKQSATGTHGTECAAARAAFTTQFGKMGRWKKLTGAITVTGPSFFDKLHKQTGVAPNGIEIHPVLGFWNK